MAESFGGCGFAQPKPISNVHTSCVPEDKADYLVSLILILNPHALFPVCCEGVFRTHTRYL